MRYLFTVEQEQQEKAERALQILENKLIKTLDACQFGIILFDEQGQCLGLNKRWQSIYHMDYDQMRDYNMLEDTNLQGKHIWPAIKSSFEGEPGVVEDNYFTPEEWDKPGRGRWTRGFAMPLFLHDDPQETQVGQALMLQDVTDEKTTISEVEKLRHQIEEIKTEQQTLMRTLLSLQEVERRLLNARPLSMPSVQQLRERAPLIPRREREVFEKLAAGLTVKEAAHQLNLGAKSVYTYRTRLLNRLKLTCDVELAIAWREINDRPMKGQSLLKDDSLK